jgi:hypothetical protein
MGINITCCKHKEDDPTFHQDEEYNNFFKKDTQQTITQSKNIDKSLIILQKLDNHITFNDQCSSDQTGTFGKFMKESLINSPNNNFLKLTIKDSKFYPKNYELTINQKGLEGSSKSDGVVKFGKNINSDFILQDNEGLDDNHFQIVYDYIHHNYNLLNPNGNSVFIKIQDKTLISEGMIISFGTNHLLFHFSKIDNQIDSPSKSSIIKFKGIYGVNKDKIYEYNSDKSKIIRLGRKQINNEDFIIFNELSTSKLHASILFINNKWFICDGDGINKNSVNGTWYLSNKSQVIENKMNIRVGGITFEAII